MSKRPLYFVMWHGLPMHWNERWSRFYDGAGHGNGAGYGKWPVTLMTSRALAKRRIKRSLASWGKEDTKDYLVRIARQSADD